MMRAVAISLVLCVGVACQQNDSAHADPKRVDATQLYESSGEVSFSDGGSLRYEITSESYKQWYSAQQGLDRRIASRFGALLQPSSPSERSIDRAVQYLQSEPRAREAIAKSGMSVRGFVEMTVALEQQMRVATANETQPLDTMPLPVPYPYPLDTMRSAYPQPYPTTYPPGYPSPQPYPPAYPPGYQPPAYPAVPLPSPALPSRRVDSVPRTDSGFLPRVDSILRRDTLFPRRDTIVPRRDTTIRRDTLALPRPPRDTVRVDTLSLPGFRSR
jgi:hypothetical protein